MKHRTRQLLISSFCVALRLFPYAPNLEAKAWRNGYIVELHPDSFVLQTRFYPHIIVHTATKTKVRCKKQFLPISDLQLHDLVTVEGPYRPDGSIDATKITIHRNWLECRKIKGPKPAHCKC